MDVKFITTERQNVDTVPITDGQVITCKDYSDLFYDMRQTRYHVGDNMWKPIVEDKLTPGFLIDDGTVSVIQFVPNEGTDVILQSHNIPNYVIGTVGNEIEFTTLPETTREGYTFLGWYESPDLQGDKVEVFPARYTQGKTVYYASWVKN